jgi:hypothetical protein
MNQPEQRFSVNTRVKLRGDVDPSFYNGFSRTGNEGWIRKRKRDKYGYPQIFIQWDKDHWAYNGQEDGWTWEGQFEAVEEDVMAETPRQSEEMEAQVRGITENFVSALFGALGHPEGEAKSEVEETSVEESQSEEAAQWESLAAEAGEAIVNSPGYLVIALEYAKAPDAPPMIIPRVFHASRKPDYALIVQSQLAHLVASLQDATIAQVIDQKSEDEDQEQ